jgi:hypothetical protein
LDLTIGATAAGFPLTISDNYYWLHGTPFMTDTLLSKAIHVPAANLGNGDSPDWYKSYLNPVFGWTTIKMANGQPLSSVLVGF